MKKRRKALVRRPVDVTVAILNDDPPQFALEAGKGSVPIQKGRGDPILSFNNNQGGNYQDGFLITFNLVDRTGKGYVYFQDPYAPDPNDALSVKLVGPNGYCPRRGQKWAGFTPTSVTDDTLIVENPNEHLQYFGFALHFSLPGQKKPSLTYDPIGDNQNGNAF